MSGAMPSDEGAAPTEALPANPAAAPGSYVHDRVPGGRE